MINITKQEAFKMRELGFSDKVHKTYTKHPTYFLTEDVKCLKALNDYKRGLIKNGDRN